MVLFFIQFYCFNTLKIEEKSPRMFFNAIKALLLKQTRGKFDQKEMKISFHQNMTPKLAARAGLL